MSQLFILFIAEQDSLYECTTICLSIRSSVDGRLGFFQLLAVTNKASMNIHEQVFVYIYTFVSLGSRLRKRMARSYNRYVFNFLKCSFTELHLIYNTQYIFKLHNLISFDTFICL